MQAQGDLTALPWKIILAIIGALIPENSEAQACPLGAIFHDAEAGTMVDETGVLSSLRAFEFTDSLVSIFFIQKLYHFTKLTS